MRDSRTWACLSRCVYLLHKTVCCRRLNAITLCVSATAPELSWSLAPSLSGVQIYVSQDAFQAFIRADGCKQHRQLLWPRPAGRNVRKCVSHVCIIEHQHPPPSATATLGLAAPVLLFPAMHPCNNLPLTSFVWKYIGATFSFIGVALDKVDFMIFESILSFRVCRCSILLGCTSFGVCSLLDKVSLL